MNKLRNYLVSLIIIFLMINISFAQNYEFKVMASSGAVKVYNNDSKSWTDAKIGTKVKAQDKLKLSKNAYLSLIHKSGRSLELKKSGEFNVRELSNSINSKKSNVTSKFADYLIDEISSSDDLLAEGNRNMSTTGSVTREIDQPFMKKNSLKLNSPRKVNFLGKVFTFNWLQKPGIKKYEFILSDRFDRPVFTKEVASTSITLNADELKLEKNTYYFWKVKAKGDDKTISEDACFMVLSNDKSKAILDTVKLIKDDLGNENTATSRIILAAYYEQNYLIDEALQNYREAVRLAPDVELYQKLYQRFLNRINIVDSE